MSAQTDPCEIVGAWQRVVFGPRSVLDAVADELALYCGIPRELAVHRMYAAESAFAEHWHRASVDSTSERQLINFYNSTDEEIFELMHWHATDPAPANYLVAARLAAKLGATNVLDFGSGVGSGAIAFAATGLSVTLADVSTPLLAFARWRIEQRGLTARFIDLKMTWPPEGTYDLLVCLDVLEHSPDPLRLLRRLRRLLRTGGLLVVNTPFGRDSERPMHIALDRRLPRRFRSEGFRDDWELAERFPFRGSGLRVLQRVSNWPGRRLLFWLYDVALPPSIVGVLRRLCQPARADARRASQCTRS